MNLLIIILNRVYCFLTKVKNQSPLLGASILASILISAFINNIFLLIYSFKLIPLNGKDWIYYIIVLLIFIFVYYFSLKNKVKITNNSIYSSSKNNLIVIFLFLFTLIFFIIFGNINRDKILKDKINDETKPKKESLEGRIRKWFNE